MHPASACVCSCNLGALGRAKIVPNHVERKVLDSGFKKAQMDECIAQYVAIDVFEKTEEGDKIRYYVVM